MKHEIWAPILSAPGYEVSTLGRVRQAGRIVPVHKDRHGGLMFNAKVKGKYTTKRLARVVGGAFCLGYHPSLRPRFLDGDPTNCVSRNIVWDTPNANRIKYA